MKQRKKHGSSQIAKPKPQKVQPERYRPFFVFLLHFTFIPFTKIAAISSSAHVKFTNSFTHGGCLYQRKESWKKKRVCGSEDPREVTLEGDYYCDSSDPFQHTEIRLHAQNWESSLFETWILQILLSEVLQVPTSVETSLPGHILNFYDTQSRIQLGAADDFDCLVRGFEVGDCQMLQQGNDEDYQRCCHFIPEVWNFEMGLLEPLIENGSVQTPLPMGTIGEENFYIPKFTAERDPRLTSYVGLSQSRQRLAERFLRPTTWREYCSQVADCHSDGGDGGDGNVIAQRAPAPDDPDGDRFFVPGLYQGHFRATARNDCSSFPNNCTGHVFDYPCVWKSHAIQQLYHLGIAVEGDGEEGEGGYTHEQLIDALKAANATKSDILIYWWTPEALSEHFIGTDMELTNVVLPPVTLQCLENRVTKADRCSSHLDKRIGSPLGACGNEPLPLAKLVGAGLHQNNPSTTASLAMQSPAYELLRSFQMSGPETRHLFQLWITNNATGKDDPRGVVCDWAIENFDQLQRFIPRTFPRVVQAERTTSHDSNWRKQFSRVMASLAIVVVLVTTALIYRQRQRPVMQFAQLEFLTLLLTGLTLVSVGSLLMIFGATSPLCIAFMWLINLGYTLELAPLIVKMAAIHRIMRASKRLRHVVVTRRALVGSVLLLCAVTLTLLMTMTLLDPPKLSPEYILSAIVNGARETVVFENCYCRSKSNLWLVFSVTWHLALLLVATIQAVLTRNVRQELNDSRTLAFMIYSQFIFVLLQLATLFIRDDLLDSERARAQSILYSLDCIVTVSLYFVPKLISKDEEFEGSDEMVGSATVKKLRMLAAIASAQHDRQLNRLQTERESNEQDLADDSHQEVHHEGLASERFGSRMPVRLSIPSKEFEAHLRDVDSAASEASLMATEYITGHN